MLLWLYYAASMTVLLLCAPQQMKKYDTVVLKIYIYQFKITNIFLVALWSNALMLFCVTGAVHQIYQNSEPVVQPLHLLCMFLVYICLNYVLLLIKM